MAIDEEGRPKPDEIRLGMGEVEFFNKMKTINRLLTNEAREKIWNYILNGELINVKHLFDMIDDGRSNEMNKIIKEL